ncbi:hypothetical protein [Streptomyces sp. NPDC088752]|uniref:hypothetical protein n=1 Tax=Streptomyces sp. NPDC088752 TaxID=3154963 RepID=UPI00342A3471
MIAPVLTGRGYQADKEATFHVLRSQPGRTLDDLDAKDDLLDLLDHAPDGPLAKRLLAVAQKFAAPSTTTPTTRRSRDRRAGGCDRAW